MPQSPSYFPPRPGHHLSASTDVYRHISGQQYVMRERERETEILWVYTRARYYNNNYY